MQVILRTLRDKKLYTKLSKCEFWLREMRFLVHVISSDGIAVDSLKMDAMLDWEASKTMIDIMSFLGLEGYYRGFKEGFSKLELPMSQLTHKG